ncbi:MAG: BrnA antitoxin family protein [Fibrobacter sp.]|jgi:predicted DNA binding CopG/RHH family protein|uniref:CopG family antitoxin n=1 Tax=unclassified Fibrobacter TaxID=2634177 RepID=UPI0025C5D09A|nr:MULTISPECIES: CopG family antitoxin [unclassified Fibrobacter]MBQ3721191.1 BrnA antitoxin family protein [Fibrobacter sp.]MBQ7080816.1 BrnA antitoxin family protein [Fibrobacter sp.]MBR2058265.1 BrnA antitoxin family protein [Fibrobacter sp.]MBR4008930.1 BrnA antitoxin family protein [Fibrobacter sp.]
MKKEYDFSKMKPVKNPYAKVLKKQVTIRLNSNTIDYFKEMAKEVGIPYQVLIDSYLTDCAVTRRKLNIRWQ